LTLSIHNKYLLVSTGVLLTFVVGSVDYMTGTDMSLSIFYVLPIALVTWYCGRNCGMAIAVLAALLWFVADVIGSERHFSQPLPYWNALVRFGLFSIIVYLLGGLRNLSKNLEQKVTARTAELLTEIAERRKTEEQLKRNTEKLRLLAKRAQNIKEEENMKIAREIHDQLGQALTAIKIETVSLTKKYSNDSALVERLMDIVNIVNDTIKTVRNISSRLRPRLLDELGLMPAIEFQLKEFQQKTGVQCNLFSVENGVKIPSDVSTAAFRIFQEAITNVARHADATKVDVTVSFDSGENLLVTVADNGKGMSSRNGGDLDTSKGLGILGMMERAHLLGGSVELKCSEEGGTIVKAMIPIFRGNSRIDR
jgi:signal transduction histidine kinase